MAEVWTPPAFDDISTSETVTAAQYNAYGNSLRFLKRVAHQTFASDVSVTATAVGSANQIVSAGAITYEAVPHQIVFYCPRATNAAVVNHLILRDSTTVIGTLLSNAASANVSGVYAQAVLTPTAASHTYNVASWNAAAGTWTYQAGSGGAAGDTSTFLAGFISIYRIPT